MILQPGILALVASSILISAMLLYAAGHGVLILLRWDLSSGSELQLALERRTYLISTVTSCFLAFQLLSLFFFIQTVDGICHLFVGAMCAAGTLGINGFGYPALLLKIVTFILAGLWLILNHADNQGYDYPLIRPKYRLLLVISPIVMAETAVQGLFFAGLRPDIITSCCGTLFSQASPNLASDLAALPSAPMELFFYGCIAATLTTGITFLLSGTGAYLFGWMSATTFGLSILSMVSFISLYFYEMPSHHCPFCILQKEYGYLGYPLYLTLLLGTVAGLGVGALHPFRGIESIQEAIPATQSKLAVISVISFLVFASTVSFRILFSSFRLQG